MGDIRVSIDRGGTFCDVIATSASKPHPLVFKLLSEDPANYLDAPSEAIRRILEQYEGKTIPRGEKLDASRIASCRIGTTVATNSLLTGNGERFAFATTKGFKDVCVIGDQSRPELFNLKIRKAAVLHDTVVEIDERVTVEDYDLNPHKKALDIGHDVSLIKTRSGEVIRVIKRPDEKVIRQQLQSLREQGYTSLAVCFMHAYIFPDHERIVAEMAKDVGFEFVTISSETSPAINFLQRSNSTCSEAYLYPIIKRYIDNFQSGFEKPPKKVEFMCSDGGLKKADKFRGNEALLSGPAGGVVGTSKCFDIDDGTPVIGFDMGGTSTDVSRYDGKYDFLRQTTIAGRTINLSMLNIATVAAGGGSILFIRNGLLTVGPESAGAHPGPACYRKGGPLTVTDANLFLGRLVLSSFPAIFGESGDQELDIDIVAQKFKDITEHFNRQTSQCLKPEEMALGFLNVANETMSRPIRNATEARGYAPENHNLVSFGGAGGQHACAIADKLGIRRVLIHKLSSILSAHGIAHAELQYEIYEPFAAELNEHAMDEVHKVLTSLKIKVTKELVSQHSSQESLIFDEILVLKYFGTDTNLSISKPADGDYAAAFKSTHLREFAFSMNRPIIIESVKVRGSGSTVMPSDETSACKEMASSTQTVFSGHTAMQKVYFDGAWQVTRVFSLDDIPNGSLIHGPAIIIDRTQTILVEPLFKAHVLSNYVVLEKALSEKHENPMSSTTQTPSSPKQLLDPIQLSVFAHRFMAIAEQMGNTLQRTSISSSIKERLDFSCAIFSPEGKLVANAPHIPIHLGSMQFAVQAQHRHWRDKLKPGDVLLTNHPSWGGTHLPDLTVVTPVFIEGQIAFYVASRGHHTDIGGIGITSMMPESRYLWEEGIIVPTMKIVSSGEFLESEIRATFDRVSTYPGCSTTRRILDNISDLKAQISANQRGIVLLQNLCNEYSLEVVHKYMAGIQDNAELAVREFFKKLANEHPDPLSATDYLDDGTAMKVKITIDKDTGSAIYDFAGSGPQMWGNYNCPISITHSAIIYSIRCLVNLEIPLNEGCLAPCDIRVPEGSILDPTPTVAICGSTLASQRVIDLVLRAFGCFGASQGCANALGWGMGGKNPLTGHIEPGWNYGESIGGGVGAGKGYDGESGVHVHSTNTRQTDSEVIEKRTAVLVRKYGIRSGSGGKGRWQGGDGITREIEARASLKFSILSDRRVYRPYGMAGGHGGQKGENLVFKFNEERELVASNLGGKAVVKLEPGEYIQINTPGGGGYGTPEDQAANPASDDFHRAFT
ncbi:hypothetical protein FBEOM_9162 [Fusarium beomiforme]|uniref:5-oxoprolinase n=1 Tax=Fusarium beomiforme TaxID=44412 RepID=A0A9P5DTL6_9HYPO|nr:hypothetical protein FBEOM_9162 [Fusarium beomiforme]